MKSTSTGLVESVSLNKIIRYSMRNSTLKQRRGCQSEQVRKLSAGNRKLRRRMKRNLKFNQNSFSYSNKSLQNVYMKHVAPYHIENKSIPKPPSSQPEDQNYIAKIQKELPMNSTLFVPKQTVACQDSANIKQANDALVKSQSEGESVDSNHSLKRIKYVVPDNELKPVSEEEDNSTSKLNHATNGSYDKEEPPSPSNSPRVRGGLPRHNVVYLAERNPSSVDLFNKHMPWFGIDVGGTLVKVVFFDPKDATSDELVTLRRIRRYLKSSKPYGTSGKRDAHLEMPNCIINKRVGTLHFIRFATNRMPDFLSMAKTKRFAETIHTVCATGGGAYKFEDDIKTNLGITLHKTDELDSIIYGIHYIDKYNSDRECYFLQDPLDDEKCLKVPYDFSRPYPYLVVNIGSGVSILAVYSSTSYSRISGSSIGGGTFLGLCCLLTQCKTFDEAIKLAKAGSSAKLDKLVKDIYGGDYPKFNLSGDTVASSFGHANIIEKTSEVKREDLARGLLEMVTINIGLIARICAEKEDIDRVVFIGNFLRVNQLSMKLLSYAVNYWSKGCMKALFLEHEGYFGAVGCFVESTQGCYH